MQLRLTIFIIYFSQKQLEIYNLVKYTKNILSELIAIDDVFWVIGNLYVNFRHFPFKTIENNCGNLLWVMVGINLHDLPCKTIEDKIEKIGSKDLQGTLTVF